MRHMTSPGYDKPIRVMVVDDNDALRQLVTVILGLEDGIEVVAEARDGFEAVTKAEQLRPDVVLMDVTMPRCSGPEATRAVMEQVPETHILAWTGHTDSKLVTEMIVAGAVGYMLKGQETAELASRIRACYANRPLVDTDAMPGLLAGVTDLARREQARRREAEQLYDQLEEAYTQTISSLVMALRCKDAETEGHADRVVDLAVAVGRELHLSEPEQQQLRWGALFHDIGKIGLPDAILTNEDPLDSAEWEVVKQHTIIGERIIKPIAFLADAARLVRHSHEHWDGSGYPDGLAGRSIPRASRIILACDAYDAMTAGRSYQRAMTPREGVARLRELAGVRFDAEVVAALVEVLKPEMDEPEAPAAVARRERASAASAPAPVDASPAALEDAAAGTNGAYLPTHRRGLRRLLQRG